MLASLDFNSWKRHGIMTSLPVTGLMLGEPPLQDGIQSSSTTPVREESIPHRALDQPEGDDALSNKYKD